MVCCVVVAGGLFALTRLPLGLTPALELPSLSVNVSWEGASAESIEQLVTVPVEEIAGSLKGVRKIRSTSQAGRSRVSIDFDQRTDMNYARLALNEQLAMLARQLPQEVSRPHIERSVPEDIEQLQGFLEYSLTGPFSTTVLGRLANQEIVPHVIAIPGVTNVTIGGSREAEIRVELLPDRLAATGLAVGDIVSAIEKFTGAGPGGRPSGSAGCLNVVVAGGGASFREFDEIPVWRVGSSRPFHLRDVGTAVLALSPPQALMRVNGEECVTVVITRDPASNLLTTAHKVKECLSGLRSRLPSSVKLVCGLDRSSQMEAELTLLSRDACFSLIALWAILAAFLGNSRAPFLLLTSVFLSIAGTFLLLWILRVPLHLLTLAGLALGFGRLLDDSIVVLENLRRWNSHDTTLVSVMGGTKEVGMPVVASTVAMVGALAPVLFLPRDVQVFIQESAVAVAASMAVSLLVSLTVTPTGVLRWRMEGRWRAVADSGGLIGPGYKRLVGAALRHRRLVLLAALWIFGLPIWLLPVQIENASLPARLYNLVIGGRWYSSVRPVINTVLGGVSYQFFNNVPHAEFLNPGTETTLLVNVEFPVGTDIAVADAVARHIESDLLSQGAPRVTTRVLGTAALLRIDFPDSTVGTVLPGTLRNRCFHLAAQTSGARVTVVGFGAGFLGGAEQQPSFMIRVMGCNYTRVKEIAASLRDRLSANPRVVAVDIDRTYGNWSRAEEVVLKLDQEAALRYGLTRQDIAGAIFARTTRHPVGMPFNVQGVRYQCIVSVKGCERLSVPELKSATITQRYSAQVPLGSLLESEQRTAPSEIRREDQQYVRCVTFEFRGPYRLAQAFLDATVNSFPLHEGYRFDRSDVSAASERDRSALIMAVLCSLLIVFMVTAALFESLIDPLIIMLSVPFACIGVFAAFLIAEMPFGRGGYLSVIFLTGIAVANAIVIVDFIGKKVKTEGRNPKAIIDAAGCRLRPVLMTTLTTAASMVPMLLGDRSSIWYSVALGTLWGTLSSATLTLLVIPVSYAIAHKLSPVPSLDSPPRSPSLT
jgi:hydrophobic/amphiphilic exporter-1 (mainly G- bacteria), HAE1 family